MGVWGGYVEFSYFLVLHASPIKICPNCAGPLACFKYLLSHPWEGTTIESKEGEGVELLYSFLVASHFSNQDQISSCCAGPLACFNYLSCPGG